MGGSTKAFGIIPNLHKTLPVISNAIVIGQTIN